VFYLWFINYGLCIAGGITKNDKTELQIRKGVETSGLKKMIQTLVRTPSHCTDICTQTQQTWTRGEWENEHDNDKILRMSTVGEKGILSMLHLMKEK